MLRRDPGPGVQRAIGRVVEARTKILLPVQAAPVQRQGLEEQDTEALLTLCRLLGNRCEVRCLPGVRQSVARRSAGVGRACMRRQPSPRQFGLL